MDMRRVIAGVIAQEDDAALSFTHNEFYAIYLHASTWGSHTYTIDIGTAASDRIVVLAIGTVGGGTDQTRTSVTIGGNAATLAVEGTSDYGNADIWYLEVASGTSASVVVNKNASTKGRLMISSYSLYGAASATPVDTKQTTNNGTGLSPVQTLTPAYSGSAVTIASYKTGATDPAAVGSFDVITTDGEDMELVMAGSDLGTAQAITGTNTGDGSVNYISMVTASWQ